MVSTAGSTMAARTHVTAIWGQVGSRIEISTGHGLTVGTATPVTYLTAVVVRAPSGSVPLPAYIV